MGIAADHLNPGFITEAWRFSPLLMAPLLVLRLFMRLLTYAIALISSF
eukprot:CAMPEP_0198110090 /NCGR_PEP_ID=MMETSP1442-20131203/2129_1 /TAXON_ID= /ORGANISM="Craspedostauros australis, Strain CCMP3328" /LENGTH=47 /DNA_ID= /DNA_START= /DNA_END= /DNA_ORIENTATION=